MGTFFEKPLMLLIHQYTYFEIHYLLSFTLQGIFMPYIHTLCNTFLCHTYLHIYLHTIEKHLPRHLGVKIPIMGQPTLLPTSPYLHAFLHSKPKFKSLGISHASLH